MEELKIQINAKCAKCAHVDVCESEKKYGQDGAGSFINGILANFAD